MRKLYTLLLTLLVAATATAQETPNRLLLHDKAGNVYTYTLADMDYIEFTHEDEVLPDPKIGDYFYSDGTWSDGGLISIDADGQNAVWADEKPEPKAGKTVIGIVSTTDPNRMAEADKAAGYTHGYVLACKNATDPTKFNYEKWPETLWYTDTNGSVCEKIQVTKLASSCYKNLDGRTETATMMAGYENPADSARLFYYCTEGFPVAAPANTSGWFVPSVGQMWDCLANFCSGDVAKSLASVQNYGYDFTYYVSFELGNNVLDAFLKVYEKVPAANKDDIKINDSSSSNGSYIAMHTSSRYDTESCVVWNIGTDDKGVLEGMAAWNNEEAHARPMLAF